MSVQASPSPLDEQVDEKPAGRVEPDGTPLDDLPLRRTERGVQFDESRMEVHRPYPFKLPDSDVWLIAVRQSTAEGDVKLYQLA